VSTSEMIFGGLVLAAFGAFIVTVAGAYIYTSSAD
jgi:hypothetical protein